MYLACQSLRDALLSVGVCIDGGKDSLSMAAKASNGELVKSPGTLSLTAYVTCPDVRLTVTPDLKAYSTTAGNDGGVLLLVDLSEGYCRCGASSLGTVFGQIGKLCVLILEN